MTRPAGGARANISAMTRELGGARADVSAMTRELAVAAVRAPSQRANDMSI
jgi:hypothetical protein